MSVIKKQVHCRTCNTVFFDPSESAKLHCLPRWKLQHCTLRVTSPGQRSGRIWLKIWSNFGRNLIEIVWKTSDWGSHGGKRKSRGKKHGIVQTQEEKTKKLGHVSWQSHRSQKDWRAVQVRPGASCALTVKREKNMSQQMEVVHVFHVAKLKMALHWLGVPFIELTLGSNVQKHILNY